MVSAWWLLAVFWFGGVLGLMLGVLVASTRRDRHDDDDQQAALERWRRQRHQGPPSAGCGGHRPGTVPRI